MNPQSKAAGPSPGYKWAALATVSTGVFVSVIAGGVVNISLPTISSDFDAQLSTVQWVVSIYLLTISALLLPMGRASDILGRKRVYIAGYVFFLLGAGLSAAADNIAWLLAARAVQAIGGAGIQANGMAIAAAVFPANERGKALGINSTVVASGAISGPILGGLMVDVFGWRSVFLLVGTVGVLGMIAASKILKEEWISVRRPERQGLDFLGMVTSAIAIVATLVVLTQGNSLGWGSPTTLAIALVGIAAMATFFVAETRAPFPMVDLSLLRRRAVGLGSLAAFLSFVATAAGLLLMPFYLQGVLAFEARTSGLVMAPQMAMLAIFGPLGGRLSDRLGARVLSTAGAVTSATAVLLLSRLEQDSHVVEAIVPMMLLGAGLGLFQPANQNSVLSAVERERYGLVAGFLTLMRNLGQVMGLAIATLVVTQAITSFGIDADLGLLRNGGGEASPLLIDGFITGLRRAYLVAGAILLTAALVSASRGARQPIRGDGA